ncbi:hypothetical protein AAC387_Pa05g2768 [Persea americana]
MPLRCQESDSGRKEGMAINPANVYKSKVNVLPAIAGTLVTPAALLPFSEVEGSSVKMLAGGACNCGNACRFKVSRHT